MVRARSHPGPRPVRATTPWKFSPPCWAMTPSASTALLPAGRWHWMRLKGDDDVMTTGPLEGISILAAEQMHALPHATQLMALLGATVIKVEPPHGDTARHGRPMVHDRGTETGSTFVRNNLGKSSVAIDLKQDAGRELFLRLAATVDAVAENMRPGTVDRLGIGYEAVRAVNPAVVYVSLSGFGNATDPASPYREWAAYAPIVEGMAGLYEYSRG